MRLVESQMERQSNGTEHIFEWGMAEMWFSICGWEELQQQPGCEKLTAGLSSARSWKSQSNYGIFSSSNDGRVDHPTKE